MRIFYILAVLTTAMTVHLGGASADVVMLNPAKDNTLYEDPEGDLSNGAGPHMFAGPILTGAERRAVMAFDVAGSIPPGSTITSVSLTLRCNMELSGSVPAALHRLNSEWGEGTSTTGLSSPGGMGAPAATGDATWLHTFFPSQFWNNPGGDYQKTVSDVVDVDAPAFYTWGSTEQMVADAQHWLDNPGQNFGWILISGGPDGSAKRYATRENLTVGDRPVLNVEFDPPAGGSFGDCDDDGDIDLADFGQFQLCFTGPDGGPIGKNCMCSDNDRDGDVDLVDFSQFQLAFTGPK